MKTATRSSEFWVIHNAQFSLAKYDDAPSFAPWARCTTWKQACDERKRLAGELLEGETIALEIVRVDFVTPRRSMQALRAIVARGDSRGLRSA